MKTISLTDSAYERLCAWKESRRDSFSKVVERVVPARGTMGSVLDAWKRLPQVTGEQMDALEKDMKAQRDWSGQRDPWTS